MNLLGGARKIRFYLLKSLCLSINKMAGHRNGFLGLVRGREITGKVSHDVHSLLYSSINCIGTWENNDNLPIYDIAFTPDG